MSVGPRLSILDLPAAAPLSLGHGDWIELSEEDLALFAISTRTTTAEIDPPSAGPGPRMVDGFHLLALLAHWHWHLWPVAHDERYLPLNYGLDRVRFLRPVHLGDRLRGNSRVVEASERRPGEVMVVTDCEVECDRHDGPVLVARWLHYYVPRERPVT